MNTKIKFFISLFICASVILTTAAKCLDNVSPKENYNQVLPFVSNQIFDMTADIDLEGRTYQIPEGVTIRNNGFVICNGNLVGNNTRIIANKAMFNRIGIKGTWNVQEISTSLFCDLDYENSLGDVMALAHPNIKNTIIIEEGSYFVSVEKGFNPAVSVPSNTDLVINGEIKLIPNRFKGCYVLFISDAENVTVSGNGSIIGDRFDHKGTKGEWGHGIYITHSNNVAIKKIKVRSCWGDCIYVGGQSKNISICDCELDGSRRQGISVSSANGVIIEGCHISNIEGTNPQSAIDIEPLKDEEIDNVVIKNVQSVNCFSGIETWKPNNSKLGSVEIKNCSIKGAKSRWPLVVRHAKKAIVEGCVVECEGQTAIMAAEIEDLTIINNNVTTIAEYPIVVSKCRNKVLKSNKFKHRNSLHIKPVTPRVLE